MQQNDYLEDWHWTVNFTTSHTDVADLDPQQIWSALWARMSHAHRYISKPELKIELSEDGKTLTVSSAWRSMQQPEDAEVEVLEQTPGCYLAWYKNQDQWEPEYSTQAQMSPSRPPIDAPW